MTSPDWSS